ncbi:MAG: hypothetical protein WED05_00520 [Candidatus Atabeyarchaeum deiterrae]
MVERALGEGMILVSPRPTISENILANSGTKVIFKCPYDSKRVARFLNLSEQQEMFLKVLPRREAIVTVPDFPYPFRIRTLDSTLSTLATASLKSAEPSTIAYHNRQDNRLPLKEDEDCMDEISINEEHNSESNYDSNASVSEKDAFISNSSINNRGVDQPNKGDLERLLKKGIDSDRFKVFKAVALRNPDPVEASIIVEEELGGQWWRLLDAYRSLQDTRLWKQPLIRKVRSGPIERNEDECVAFQLTEYGDKFWKAFTVEPTTESRRPHLPDRIT